jgi:hypothetical protein
MHFYTISDLLINVYGCKFILPFDISTKDDVIIIILISQLLISENLNNYFKIDKKKNIEIGKDFIKIPCIYQGYYYESYNYYNIVLELFRLKYDDYNFLNRKRRLYNEDKTEVQNGQLMISLYVEATDKEADNELLQELFTDNILPNLITILRLKGYLTYFNLELN